MSVGVVNKSTGDRIPTAGNPLDKVGNLANLTTTAKTDAVAAINEVNAGLAGKQSTLTFDNVPTDGSNNPVKSDGIYDALTGKADTGIVAAEFNAGTSYTAGNYCIHEGKFYKFKNNHSGAWAAADVDEIKIAGELSAINSNIATLSGTITANEGITITSYILKKSVNVVFLEMLVQFTPTLDSNNQIGIIASGYRPSGKVFCNCENDTRRTLVKAFVDTHGAIYIVPTSDDSAAVAQNYYLNCTFIVS